MDPAQGQIFILGVDGLPGALVAVGKCAAEQLETVARFVCQRTKKTGAFLAAARAEGGCIPRLKVVGVGHKSRAGWLTAAAAILHKWRIGSAAWRQRTETEPGTRAPSVPVWYALPDTMSRTPGPRALVGQGHRPLPAPPPAGSVPCRVNGQARRPVPTARSWSHTGPCRAIGQTGRKADRHGSTNNLSGSVGARRNGVKFAHRLSHWTAGFQPAFEAGWKPAVHPRCSLTTSSWTRQARRSCAGRGKYVILFYAALAPGRGGHVKETAERDPWRA